MEITEIRKLDEKYIPLILKARATKDPEGFSKNEKIKMVAFEIVDLLSINNIRPTYKNLTNSNLHLLVKILNYNDFFKKELTKDLREELKKLTFIY